MNVYDVLKEDHEEVSKLLKKIEKTSERDEEDRKKYFVEVKKDLELHSFVEEKYFYTALEEFEATKEIALEAREEHRIVKILLDELDDLDKDAEEWGPKFKVLKENVEHHVEEEEGELFRKARKVLSDDQALAIGAEIVTEKAKLKAII